jgi:hypothetical protein
MKETNAAPVNNSFWENKIEIQLGMAAITKL